MLKIAEYVKELREGIVSRERQRDRDGQEERINIMEYILRVPSREMTQ
jgi:hypothetical protein